MLKLKILYMAVSTAISFGVAVTPWTAKEPKLAEANVATTTTIKPTTTSTTSTTVKPHTIDPPRANRATALTALPTGDFHYLGPCITQYESGGGVPGHKSYTAQNPTSTASGEAQWLDTTWNNWHGYAHAKDAPAKDQDERLDADLSQPLWHIRQEWSAQRQHCNF